jgi:hypothetical protein
MYTCKTPRLNGVISFAVELMYTCEFRILNIRLPRTGPTLSKQRYVIRSSLPSLSHGPQITQINADAAQISVLKSFYNM